MFQILSNGSLKLIYVRKTW